MYPRVKPKNYLSSHFELSFNEFNSNFSTVQDVFPSVGVMFFHWHYPKIYVFNISFIHFAHNEPPSENFQNSLRLQTVFNSLKFLKLSPLNCFGLQIIFQEILYCFSIQMKFAHNFAIFCIVFVGIFEHASNTL